MRRYMVRCLAVALVLFAGLSGWADEEERPLPLPEVNIPEQPPFPPTVITAGGQRLLLGHTDVALHWDEAEGRLESNRPGWWVINYPLDRIRGFGDGGAEAAAAALFGERAGETRNWYHKTLGEPAPEPPAPTGPAPIELTPAPDLVVDARHPEASMDNTGGPDDPLPSIQAAVDRAGPGAIIHVAPGIYRERVHVETSGEKDNPIRIEGVRDEDGSMPVISGNDVFPPGAWTAVEGLPGVHHADLFTDLPGTVSMDGETLIERNRPAELEEGEFAINRAPRAFLEPSLDGSARPKEGDEHAGASWRMAEADDDGYVHLAEVLDGGEANAIVWLSTWVWLDPQNVGEAWHPDYPEPISGRVTVGDRFRAARQTGSNLGSQQNKYAVWVNGDLLPALIRATADAPMGPRAARNYGVSDEWVDFPLQEGWNHLLFQLETASRPDSVRFRFATAEGLPDILSAAAPPEDPGQAPGGEPAAHATEYLVLGPLEAGPTDRGVYVRLPGDADPNDVEMDLAARSNQSLIVEADFVHVRGFEIRHGAQFQQRAQVRLEGEGLLLEGCVLRDSEVRGLSVSLDEGDQNSEPVTIFNNWILDPGNTGIGSSGTTEHLTADNQDGPAPGRGRIFYDHNRIENPNWAGYRSMWESGGIKDFRLTGAVIRNTTVIGGHGPGIWLDWEHYNNRVESNLFLNGWGLGVGVEASPGPNLVANNVSRGLRPGQVWFRAGLLSWSSARTWTVHNTVDGLWDETENWQGYAGTEGIRRGYRGERGTAWSPKPHMRYTHVNNLILGCHTAIGAHEDDVLAGNYTDKGSGAAPLESVPAFANPERGDYRFSRAHPASGLGARHEYTDYVRHDFFGLPRLPGEPRAVGAFRAEPELPGDARAVLEVEWMDGSVARFVDGAPVQ